MERLPAFLFNPTLEVPEQNDELRFFAELPFFHSELDSEPEPERPIIAMRFDMPIPTPHYITIMLAPHCDQLHPPNPSPWIWEVSRDAIPTYELLKRTVMNLMLIGNSTRFFGPRSLLALPELEQTMHFHMTPKRHPCFFEQTASASEQLNRERGGGGSGSDGVDADGIITDDRWPSGWDYDRVLRERNFLFLHVMPEGHWAWQERMRERVAEELSRLIMWG
ncbi:uncharacterized protein BKCO1_6400013 [Diplodia corticola]|uniref:Uncharacterized protein n=1 Tax=Diplodia corticola TaxID=236234 RepID=A0A1J9QP58_9PEZI|nr:uncharacterized protein BKCO1_6400013 [Diplodia corticola]OJD30233.1 hypothetical protein BKCO1_6400013 [Diplodia corticola]